MQHLLAGKYSPCLLVSSQPWPGAWVRRRSGSSRGSWAAMSAAARRAGTCSSTGQDDAARPTEGTATCATIQSPGLAQVWQCTHKQSLRLTKHRQGRDSHSQTPTKSLTHAHPQSTWKMTECTRTPTKTWINTRITETKMTRQQSTNRNSWQMMPSYVTLFKHSTFLSGNRLLSRHTFWLHNLPQNLLNHADDSLPQYLI